ncbi:MAG: class I poly(R)-hydroxyalkanoic acid synthase [Rhodobacterales bacterium]|nr:MAG: class I poly(R)-hydroxyalkanoic acid synthase [Rhodobacterales bacterium]
MPDIATPNTDKLAENLNKINALTQRMVAALSEQEGHNVHLDAPDLQFYRRAAAAYFAEMISNPARIMEAQIHYWTESLRNWADMQDSIATGDYTPEDPPIRDRRFKNQKWESNPYFSMIRRQYQLASETISSITENMTHLPQKEREKVDFFAKQMIDMFAPTNFLATNPDALDRALETDGQSLVDGLENLVRDLEKNKKGLAVTLAQPDAFTVGEDIAATKGAVVYENRMFQLIQYSPTTPKVYAKPLLICPPWINKYYILDLRPENSLVKYAVDQGHTVFMISWVNPDASYADCGMDTYLQEGWLTALDTVLKITGQDSANCVGFCIGGTLLTCGLAYLTATGQDHKVNKATFFTTMTDFAEPGELGAFLEPGFLVGIKKEVAEHGYLDKYFMSKSFSYLRANDLVYGPSVRSYMMGEAPPVFDLLQWNSDSTNLPARMAVEYLEKLYVENQLVNGEFELLGENLRLVAIKVPIFAVSTIQDHIAPWKSTFKGLAKVRGESTFVLSESGHIAGIVNPAAKDKYGHWHNPDSPHDPDFWLENASFEKKSWWRRWALWLKDDQKRNVPARQLGSEDYPEIEPAPGRYVRL